MSYKYSIKDNEYCGILDKDGLVSLAVRSVASAADLYKDAEKQGACYFEITLNENEADIFTSLQKQNDARGAAKAVVQFDQGTLSVPEHKSENWDELLKKLNI